MRVVRNCFLIAGLAVVLLPACTVEQTQEAEPPDVDVDVTGGQLPRFDIDGPDIDVGLKETTVKVPKLVVVMEEVDVEVPYIDIDLPGEDEEERTVSVEIEVPNDGYEVDIQEVYAVDGELWVISRVNPGQGLEKKHRKADHVVINAPGDLDVRHFVIGDRPAGSHNSQYRFIDSKDALSKKLENGKLIYRG